MFNFFKKKENVITRFAPSPTGFMHVGGVRTAIYAWLLARQNGGKFILRIEDTDKKREVSGSIDHIKESLTWLGLDWDIGPYIQSENLDSYKQYAQKLIDKGFAYADPYTEEELEEFRKKADEEKRPFLYRDHRPENLPAWDGTKPLRFKIPTLKRYAWNDLVLGELSAGEEALDDFILIKSDGLPTYNFAHIVDDIEMNVTHVMRGQEFISSMPKFLSVYEALGINPPKFATLPPIMGEEGKKKLSKRDNAKDLLDYKKEGFLPDAMLNFLAFLGWNPGTDKEVFTREELIKDFDISKVQHGGARLNEEKLLWLNKEHMKLIPEEERNKEIKKILGENEITKDSPKFSDESFISKVSQVIFEHISKWSDLNDLLGVGEFVYFFKDPEYSKEMLAWKGNMDGVKDHLEWVKKTLESSDNFSSVEEIKSLIFDYATEKGRGNVLWPLRVSLSGREKSPDPFTLAYILGKEESLKRIDNAIKKL